GCAVDGTKAQKYIKRLLCLPAFLLENTKETIDNEIMDQQFYESLRLSGHFLFRNIAMTSYQKKMPQARTLLENYVASSIKSAKKTSPVT
ncbi:MAG: hypothetical protein AAF403_03365, partial [Pseudomonadota bacterium]